MMVFAKQFLHRTCSTALLLAFTLSQPPQLSFAPHADTLRQTIENPALKSGLEEKLHAEQGNPFRTELSHLMQTNDILQIAQLNELAGRFHKTEAELFATMREIGPTILTPGTEKEWRSFFEIVDENGRPTGTVGAYPKLHRDGDWHKGITVLLITTDKRIVLQKRKNGLWDVSAGGHQELGYKERETAVEEVAEELNFPIIPKSLIEIKNPLHPDGLFRKREVSDLDRTKLSLSPSDHDEQGIFYAQVPNKRFRNSELLSLFIRPIQESDLAYLRNNYRSKETAGFTVETLESVRENLRKSPELYTPALHHYLGDDQVYSAILQKIPPATGLEELGRPETPSSRRAVIFGMGNIGRGHIAALLAPDDFDLIFADINPTLIVEANNRDSYTVTPVGSGEPVIVKNFWGIAAADTEKIAAQGPEADWIFTSVGTNNIIRLKEVTYRYIRKRIEANHLQTLNVVFAENLPVDQPQIKALKDAVLAMAEDDQTRAYVENRVNFIGAESFADYVNNDVGWVGAVVNITVPPTIATASDNPLDIQVEGGGPYYLEVDKRELKNTDFIPSGFRPVENIRAAREKKLLIHNMGHAALAYLCSALGIADPAEGMRNPKIARFVQRAMRESVRGLNHRYPDLFPLPMLEKYIQGLLQRFGNAELHDTVKRIGQDPMRKLQENDRLFGAAISALEAKVYPEAIQLVIAAAIRYAREVEKVPDETLAPVMELVRKHHLQIPADEAAFQESITRLSAAGLEENRILDLDKASTAASWSELLKVDHPIPVAWEIGPGDGYGTLIRAESKPDLLFIGIEDPKTVRFINQRTGLLGPWEYPPNVRFVYLGIQDVLNRLPPNFKVNSIYIDYPDPENPGYFNQGVLAQLFARLEPEGEFSLLTESEELQRVFTKAAPHPEWLQKGESALKPKGQPMTNTQITLAHQGKESQLIRYQIPVAGLEERSEEEILAQAAEAVQGDGVLVVGPGTAPKTWDRLEELVQYPQFAQRILFFDPKNEQADRLEKIRALNPKANLLVNKSLASLVTRLNSMRPQSDRLTITVLGEQIWFVQINAAFLNIGYYGISVIRVSDETDRRILLQAVGVPEAVLDQLGLEEFQEETTRRQAA